jgi:hypothetical protein
MKKLLQNSCSKKSLSLMLVRKELCLPQVCSAPVGVFFFSKLKLMWYKVHVLPCSCRRDWTPASYLTFNPTRTLTLESLSILTRLPRQASHKRNPELPCPDFTLPPLSLLTILTHLPFLTPHLFVTPLDPFKIVIACDKVGSSKDAHSSRRSE